MGEFVIVEFPEEKENGTTPMAIVSDNWLITENDQNYCLWPTYIKNEFARIQLVGDHIAIDPDRCGKCPINVKFKTSVYQTAVLKLKFLEDHSSSEAETTRKRERNIRLQEYAIEENEMNDSSEDEAEPPRPPKIAHRSKPAESSQVYCGNASTPSLSRNLKLEQLGDVEPIRTFTPTNLTSSPSNWSSVTTTSSCCAKNEVLLGKVFTALEKMAKEMQHLVQRLPDKNDEPLMDATENITLPIHTIEELNIFNERLADDKEITKTRLMLQVIGGKDVVQTTRRILAKLISNSLALEYNWSGRNSKQCFSDLKNVLKLLLLTVRRNPFCKESTQSEIEAVAKLWLRNAPDRDGGRSKRQKQ